jgi:NTE family protein
MARIGLVLGAGGIVGQAYHAGVLAALEHDLGWDPRTADVIVGSSAGSLTGALLRLGIPASDLAAYAVEAPLSEETEELIVRLGGRDDPPAFATPSPLHMLRPWRIPTPTLLRRMAVRPWTAAASLSSLLPPGRIDIAEHIAGLHELAGDSWPDGLRICAVRRRDGRRVVFGRDGAPQAPLARAVAASCAIPGFFTPIRIGDASYIDGGAHSPTNADVLRDDDLDLVIAVSPMSCIRGISRMPDAPMRLWAHRALQREVRRLADRGVPVVTFEPGRRALSVMGVNAMADDRSAGVVQAAFLEAGRRAASSRAAARLQPVTTRRSRLVSAA